MGRRVENIFKMTKLLNNHKMGMHIYLTESPINYVIKFHMFKLKGKNLIGEMRVRKRRFVLGDWDNFGEISEGSWLWGH